jgi:hypothetical protein
MRSVPSSSSSFRLVVGSIDFFLPFFLRGGATLTGQSLANSAGAIGNRISLHCSIQFGDTTAFLWDRASSSSEGGPRWNTTTLAAVSLLTILHRASTEPCHVSGGPSTVRASHRAGPLLPIW